jgi:hypothetical protein
MVSENMREQISDGLPSAMYITASVHKTHLITSKKLENLMDSSKSIDNARHAVEDEAVTQRDRLSSRVTAEFGRPSTSTP